MPIYLGNLTMIPQGCDKVYAGSDIVYQKTSESNPSTFVIGSKYVFLESVTMSISVTQISSTHALICCNDLGGTYAGKGVVAVVDGTAVAFGSAVNFSESLSKVIKVTKLDSTKSIIVYQESNNVGKAVVATVTDDAVSFGSGYVFESDKAEQPNVCRLDNTHALIVYRDVYNDGYGTARLATITGTTISFGSAFVFNAGYTYDIGISALDSTHAIITYEDNGNSDKGTAIIATVSGEEISFGSEYLFNDATSSYTNVAALDSTHAVIVFTDGANGNKGSAIVATISGSEISLGTKTAYSTNSSFDNCVSSIDSTHVFVTHHGGNGFAFIGSISGTSISFGDSGVFNPTDTEESASSALSTTSLITAFSDIDNSYYGTVSVVAVT